MNAVQDLLFQQMQMMASGMTLPQVNSGEDKSSFQSVMDQTRGETQGAQEPEKQQKTEDTDKTENVETERPVSSKKDEEDAAQLQAAYDAMGVMQLFRVAPQETEENEETPLVEAIVPETDIPVETVDTAPVEVLPEGNGEETVETQVPVDQEVQVSVEPEAKTEPEPQVEVKVTETVEMTEERPVEMERTEDDEPEVQVEVDSHEPLFQKVESTPVKVGETYELDTRSEDMEADLAETIRQAALDGAQRVELKLNPANLGALTIELTRNGDGLLQVVLHTENSRAAGLLSEHLDGLHSALANLGQNQVQVEVQRHEESQSSQQHPFQQADPDGRGQRQNRQDHRQEQQTSPEDFLQQLRLGLVNVEEVI